MEDLRTIYKGSLIRRGDPAHARRGWASIQIKITRIRMCHDAGRFDSGPAHSQKDPGRRTERGDGFPIERLVMSIILTHTRGIGREDP